MLCGKSPSEIFAARARYFPNEIYKKNMTCHQERKTTVTMYKKWESQSPEEQQIQRESACERSRYERNSLPMPKGSMG